MRVWVLAATWLVLAWLAPGAVGDEPLPGIPPALPNPGPLPPLPDGGPNGPPTIDPSCVTLTAIAEPADATFVTPVLDSLQIGVIVAANADDAAGGFFVLLVRPFDCASSDPDSLPALPDGPGAPGTPSLPDLPNPNASAAASIPILP